MKTIFYLSDKKTTRKVVKEIVGEERLKEMLVDAKEAFFNDPYTEISYFIGNGILRIEFA